MKKNVVYLMVVFALITGTVTWAEDPDYGNDAANAEAITPDGSTVAGGLTASDNDWFVYIPTANTKVRFDLRNVDYNWKYLYVYQDTGWVDLIQATYTGAYHEIKSVTCFFETTDPVFLKLTGSEGGYEVTATELTTHAPDGFANTHVDAEILVVDDPAAIGTISADEVDHVDWFKFSTTELHQYRIRLTQLNNTNVNFKVFADDGVTELYGYNTDMTLTSWYGEDFKILVYGNPANLGNYYEISVEDVAVFTDPHGNTPGEATELTVGVDYNSAIDYNSTIFNDEDWFVFTPAGNTLYRVTLTNYDYNWKYVYVYQDKGFIDLTQATYNGAHHQTVSTTIFLDGTEPCYFKLVGEAGTYTLRVDQVAVYPPDTYGPNSDQATPVTVDAPATIGTISPDQPVNQDWFVFNTTALHKYRISLTQPSNCNTGFCLYNADGSVLLYGRTLDITVVSWFGENFMIMVDGETTRLGNQYNIKVEDLETFEDDWPNLSTLATPINKDGTIYGGVIDFDANVQADQDWMKFVAPIDGSYQFTFRNFDFNWKYYYVFSIDEANILHQVCVRGIYNSLDVYNYTLTAGTHFIQTVGGLGDYQIDVLSPEPICGDLDHPYPPGDANTDCYVDLADLALMAANWLTCSDPNPPCVE